MLVPLGLPAWALRFIIVLVIAGFFIAIVVAWGMGAKQGVAGGAHEERDELASRPSGSDRTDSVAALAMPAATDPSVAVLAFADMSPARDQGYFCEGTAEEIINALAGVRGLRVASRSGSFQFRNRAVDNREVARLLCVRAVLDGSVRKAGDRVRIAAQLVAADGALLWSETFDRRLEDIFAIQEEIARATRARIASHAARRRRGAARAARHRKPRCVRILPARPTAHAPREGDRAAFRCAVLSRGNRPGSAVRGGLRRARERTRPPVVPVGRAARAVR